MPYSRPAGQAGNNADNSGTLCYVRVEFAGFGVAANQELNSFTFAAVGSGTTVEFLQSLAGLDDSFEWFGGAVDGKFLISYESGGDHLTPPRATRGVTRISSPFSRSFCRLAAARVSPRPIRKVSRWTAVAPPRARDAISDTARRRSTHHSSRTSRWSVPTKQEPGLAWFLQIEHSQKGATRLMNRYGGQPLRLVRNECRQPARSEGRNVLWDDCLQTIVSGGDTVVMRLIGGVYERDGRFKIFSYTNDL